MKASLLVVVVVTIGAFLVFAELLLQVAGVGVYSQHDRALFFSRPSFIEDDHGALRYQPNVELREAAVYGDQVEYDTTSRTNNMGFIDTVDYPYEVDGAPASTEVVLGDSFTAGSGGTRSWVARLRELESRRRGPRRRFYNLGVSGTGVLHFGPLLASVSRDLEFDAINVAVVSNDFFRPLWRPASDERGVRLCMPGLAPEDCLQDKDAAIAPRIGLQEPEAAVLERAAGLYRQRRRGAEAALSWYQGLSLYTLACDALAAVNRALDLVGKCPHLRVYNGDGLQKDKRFAASMAALQRLVAAFPNRRYRLLHIPAKGEAYRGSYELDLGGDAAAAGFEYFPLLSLCGLEIAMFHRNDGHLNDHGYATLARCVADEVFTASTVGR